MPIRDYNGDGEWSAERIQVRYREYARRRGTPATTELTPVTTSKGDTRWVYPVMHKVIAGIRDGDPACMDIGIDFISEDRKFPFGAILKSNAARRLRQAHGSLTTQQQERIRKRVVDMLLREFVPREFREYAKLLRKIGLGRLRKHVERANLKNRYVARYAKYLLDAADQD